MENCKVVIRSGEQSPDELHHWKYIKKIKKDGKWVYYYDNRNLRLYKDGGDKVVTVTDDTIDTKIYEQSDKLFDRKATSTSNLNIAGVKSLNLRTTIYEQGKLTRAYAKGEKYVYDRVYANNGIGQRAVNSLNSAMNKGKNFIKKLTKIH